MAGSTTLIGVGPLPPQPLPDGRHPIYDIAHDSAEPIVAILLTAVILW